ncbi:hypothetical protein Uis1B_1881 [Bifidobacterium margollesii]|uniref:Uncharacterized protein n=1 Tax=Bifidobacterium margollesii TaxID=2020964 RepID=A0A2N5J7U5_9BIFI|nr:hypothetical protein Uis1B_1881 [Bifidobacterium margollesii]
MDFKKSLIHGLAMYGASTMTGVASNKQVAETILDIANER